MRKIAADKIKFANWKIFLVYLAVSLVAILPQFSVKYPSLLDDGSDLYYVKNMSFSDILEDQFFVDERTRPMRYFFRKMIFSFFGLNVSYYYFVSAIVLALVCFFIYKIIDKMIGDRKTAIKWTFLIFCFPSVWANFYRLGTDSPLLSLCILIVIYLILVERRWLAMVWLGLSLLIKETSVFYLIIPILESLLAKKIKTFWAVVLMVLGYIGLTLYKHFLLGSVFFDKVGFSVKTMAGNFEYNPWNFYVFALFLVIYGILWWKARAREQRRMATIFLSMLAASMTPLFIMPIKMDYLFLMFNAVTIIGVAYLVNLIPIKFKNETTKLFILLAVVVGVFYTTSKRSWDKLIYYNNKALQDSELVEVLLKENYKSTKVFVAIPDYEATAKIDLYINGWNGNGYKGFYPDVDEWTMTMNAKSIDKFKAWKNSDKILISNKVQNLGDGYAEEKICAKSWFVGLKCGYYIYSPKN